MYPGYSTKGSSPTPAKKAGKNLICELLIFFLVYAVGSLGNFLLAIMFAERLITTQLGSIPASTDPGDPMVFVENFLSSPHFPIITLISTTATIVIVLLFCKLIQKRSWDSIGLSRQNAFRHYFRGVCFGCLAISLPVAVCFVTGAGSFGNGDKASLSVIALFLISYLIQGASEELLFRGYFMYSVNRRYPMWVAVVLSSAMFALLHIANSGVSLAALGNLFLFGVFAALVSIRTGSIWYASGFHSAWNFIQGNFYGIKVSGMEMNGSLFHFVFDPSKGYLNGGEFGIEGGLLCTVILMIGILFLLFPLCRDPHSARC